MPHRCQGPRKVHIMELIMRNLYYETSILFSILWETIIILWRLLWEIILILWKFTTRKSNVYYGLTFWKLAVTKPVQLVGGSRNTILAFKSPFFVG